MLSQSTRNRRIVTVVDNRKKM